MPSNPYPTLSEQGYIFDPVQKIEIIFADYLAAKHSQSTMFSGQISSLSFDEFSGNYDRYRTPELIQNSLTKLYGAYFDSANIEVTDNSKTDSNVTEVKIVGELIDGDQTYQLNEVLAVNNGRINRLGRFNK